MTRRGWPARRQAAHESIVSALARCARLDDFAGLVVRGIVESLETRAGALWLLDGDRLRRAAISAPAGLGPPGAGAHAEVVETTRGEGLAGAVWQSRAPVERDTAAGYPILDHGRTVGVLELHARSGRGRSADEIEAATAVCAHLGQAVGRLRAEEAVRETDSRFRVLFASNPMPMWIYDERTLAFLAVNDAAVEQYGYTAAEFLERTILDIRPPEDVADVLEDVAGRGAAERQEGVWRHVRKDGSLFQVGVSSQRTVFYGRPSVFVMASEVGAVHDRAGAPGAAELDALTGLASRSAFIDAVSGAARRAFDRGRHIAVVAVDIDRFRDINRSAGRSGGDLALLKVARRLEGVLASRLHERHRHDLAGRVGPDDFVLLCEDVADGVAGAALADEVRAAVETLVPLRGSAVRPRIRIGLAVSSPSREVDAEALVAEAQAAIERARAGPAGDGAPPDTGTERMTRHAGIENGLLNALVGRQLHVVYQPRMSLSSDTIVGVEALARWEHPVLGSVPPTEFIPIAERTGLIVPLGVWVLEEACRAERRWHATFADRPPLIVSVNVSARQFESELAPRVAELIRRTGIDPTHLCLELTESTVMADVDAAVEVLRHLKALGVKLSIDDFGTGYSSLAYLKRLPLDELKIDRSFVEGLASDPDSVAIVAAIVATAHALDLCVVAEGVETVEQLVRLRELGCDEVQGFHVAEPGVPADIDILLAGEATRAADRRRARTSWADVEDGRGPVALVVDDAADVRALARMSLAAAGFAVHEAGSGEAALVLARDVRPDCAVLDMNLPGIDGREVARLLRRDGATADIAIVIVTAAGDPTDKSAAFDVGVDDYIVKPFAPRDLVSRVRFAMRRRQAAEEAANE